MSNMKTVSLIGAAKAGQEAKIRQLEFEMLSLRLDTVNVLRRLDISVRSIDTRVRALEEGAVPK